MQAGVDGQRVFAGRPVEEASAAVEVFTAFGVHLAHQDLHQVAEVLLLLFQVIQVAAVHVVVAVDQHPPQRIGAHAVHPARQRGFVAGEVQAARKRLVVAEYGQRGTHFGMQVAEPYQAVALRGLYEIFLQVQVQRVGAGRPDAVHARIVRTERAEVRDVAV